MNEVPLAPGTLAGRGVYAARDFVAGEVLVSYELRPLDEAVYPAPPHIWQRCDFYMLRVYNCERPEPDEPMDERTECR